MAMRAERSPPPPLDAAALERMALRYVERFATTRGKLTEYLNRKIRERGWDGGPSGEPADARGLAERMAGLGYVDDRLYAESKVAALARRGLGARRVSVALSQAGIVDQDADHVAPAIREQALASALVFARKRRIGPYGPPTDDRAVRDKQLAAMLRAGHALDLSRRIVLARDEDQLSECE